MPRIRTLKPEHRTHRKVGALDHVTYRLWVGMILEADDEGRLVYDPEGLRVLIFGFHPRVTAAMIDTSTQRLVDVGLVRRYVDHGQGYVWFPSWGEHQRINRPSPSKLPPPNDSVNAHGAITEDSLLIGSRIKDQGAKEVGLTPDTPPLGASFNGQEHGREQGHDHGPAAMRTAAREILAFLNKKAGRHYQPVDSNLDMIIALLRKGTTVAQIHGVVVKRCAKWKGDPKMDEFLRPSTLFRASNFQNYVGELPATLFGAPSDA